jgi:hypothetical protein
MAEEVTMNAVLDPSTKPAALPLSVHCNACDPDYEGQGDRHAPEACPTRPTVVRRSDPTAAILRAMIQEYALKSAEALADLWLSADGSLKRNEARRVRNEAAQAQFIIDQGFACYVIYGLDAALRHIAEFPTNDERTKEIQREVAEDLRGRLAASPPKWTQPDHEQD